GLPTDAEAFAGRGRRTEVVARAEEPASREGAAALGGAAGVLVDRVDMVGEIDAHRVLMATVYLPRARGGLLAEALVATGTLEAALRRMGLGACRATVARLLARLPTPAEGRVLGLPRNPGESNQHYHDRLVYDALQRPALTLPPLELDAVYTARIIEEVKRSRASPAAILRNIRRLTGHDLALREPWQEVHYLSQSALSGLDHLQGAPIYEYHRMQLVARRGVDWTPVLREAEADRPAGTLMLPPATHMPPLYLDGIAVTPDMARILVWAEELTWNAYGRLSVDLDLSNYAPPPMTDMGEVWIKALWTQAGLRGPYEYFSADAAVWVGYWDQRAWKQTDASRLELYPPKDILAADYEGVLRLSVSEFGINDRIQ
ncbi:UTRA domain-containing protein, partial [Candidatus Falkowbacteria bacterium]|nr:UTRA domain-containing protein [Candidatus Falkowbacteria bacterium]